MISFPLSRSARKLALRLLVLVLPGFAYVARGQTGSGAAFLNPADFPSLGDFDPAGDVTIDLSSGEMSGGASFAGTNYTQAGSALLVFDFSSFNLDAGINVNFVNAGSGSPAVVFLSQGDMTIDGGIDADGGAGVDGYASLLVQGSGGPGGNDGDAGPGAGGDGGGGAQLGYGGGGGAFAGAGGDGGSSDGFTGAGGVAYGGDLSAQLLGGSGGGTGGYIALGAGGTGGGSGGSLQLGALGVLEISGTVTVDGGSGGTGDSSFGFGAGGGGGSGGGLLAYGGSVIIDPAAAISAAGGPGAGTSDNSNGGGGGGGGEIYIAYLDAGTNAGSVSVPGGNGGPANNAGGVGSGGNSFFGQNDLVPAASAPAPTIAWTILPGAQLLLSWPAPASGYTLESATNLGVTPVVWTPVAGVTGASATIDLTGAAMFFRLSK